MGRGRRDGWETRISRMGTKGTGIGDGRWQMAEFKGGWAARRWHLLVGVRWERFQCRVAAFYFQRVSLPVQFWRPAGCPPQFRPRLPWWQPFVWRWLVLSGWRP